MVWIGLSQGQTGNLVISPRNILQHLVLIIGWGGMSRGVYVTGTTLANSTNVLDSWDSATQGKEQNSHLGSCPDLELYLLVVNNTTRITGHYCEF